MWSFTGGCAYSYECQNFITGCDETCLPFDEYPYLQPSDIAVAWEQRRTLYKDNPHLAAVTPSLWL